MNRFRLQAARGELREGTRVTTTRTFTERDIGDFGRITRDDNPVHHEPRWAHQRGYREPVCHGLLVGSMLCEPGGQWGWLATHMSFRFRHPVYPGDTVTSELTIVAIDARRRARGECVMTNQHGQIVATAELVGYLPDEAAQRLLQQMVDEGDPGNRLG